MPTRSVHYGVINSEATACCGIDELVNKLAVLAEYIHGQGLVSAQQPHEQVAYQQQQHRCHSYALMRTFRFVETVFIKYSNFTCY